MLSSEIGETPYEKLFNSLYKNIEYDDFFSRIGNLKSSIKSYVKSTPFNKSKQRVDDALNWDSYEQIVNLFNLKDVLVTQKDKFNSFTTIGKNDIRITIDPKVNSEQFLKQVFHEFSHVNYQHSIINLKYKLLEVPRTLIDDEAQAILFEKFILYDPVIKKHLIKIFNIDLNNIKSNKRIESNIPSDDMHNIIKVIVERKLLNNEITVKGLPEYWAYMLEEYMNLTEKEPDISLLQDPHWFCGDFGYFCSYLESKFYAADLYINVIKNVIEENNTLENNINLITNKLNEYNKYGTNTSLDIISFLLGRNVDYTAYFNYLENTYLN